MVTFRKTAESNDIQKRGCLYFIKFKLVNTLPVICVRLKFMEWMIATIIFTINNNRVDSSYWLSHIKPLTDAILLWWRTCSDSTIRSLNVNIGNAGVILLNIYADTNHLYKTIIYLIFIIITFVTIWIQPYGGFLLLCNIIGLVEY